MREWSPIILHIVRKGTDSFPSIPAVSCRHDTWSPAKVGPMILACFHWWPRRTSPQTKRNFFDGPNPKRWGSFDCFEIPLPKSRLHDEIRFLSATSFTGFANLLTLTSHIPCRGIKVGCEYLSTFHLFILVLKPSHKDPEDRAKSNNSTKLTPVKSISLSWVQEFVPKMLRKCSWDVEEVVRVLTCLDS